MSIEEITDAEEFVVTVVTTQHAHFDEYESGREHLDHTYLTWLSVMTTFCVVSLACSVTLLVISLRDRLVQTTMRILFVTSTANDIVFLTIFAAIFGPQHLLFRKTFTYACLLLVGGMGYVCLYNVSVCILFAIVVHQYFDVTKNSLFLRHVTERNVRVFLVLTYVACAVYRAPYFFEVGFEFFEGSYYVTYLDHSYSGAFPIYVIVSVVICELLLPFPAMVFFTVRLHRATARLPDTDVNVDDTSESAPLSSEKSLTRVVVLMSIVGVACLPFYPILLVHERLCLLYLSEYVDFLYQIIFSFILLYPSSKLLIYLAVTRGCTRGGCSRCRTLSSVTSSSSPPSVISSGVVQGQLDTVIFLSNDDRCALVNTDELSQATQRRL